MRRVCISLCLLVLMCGCPPAVDDGPVGDDDDVVQPTPGDSEAPGAVSALSVSWTRGAELSLQWTDPGDADLSGVLLVRGIDAPVMGEPATALIYEVGGVLPGGGVVVSVARGGSFVESATPFELSTLYYTAWAYDSAGNYSVAASTQITIASVIVSQIDTNPVATWLDMPPAYAAGASALFDAQSGELTLSLELTNTSGALIFNPKLVVDGHSAGALGDTGGQLEGRPALWFGPAALDLGASRSRDLVIGGLGGASELRLMLSPAQHPTILASSGGNAGNFGAAGSGGLAVVDSGAGFSTTLSCVDFSYLLGGDCQFTEPALSVDGRWAWVGLRNMPLAIVIDTTSMTATASVDLTAGATGMGSVDSLVWDPDGVHVYAVLTTNAHVLGAAGGGASGAAGNSDIHIVKLVAATMAEVDRVEITSADPSGDSGRALSISADGSRAAVALAASGRVALVDLGGMSLVGLIDVSASGTNVRYAAISADGLTIYAAYKDSAGHIDAIDLSDPSGPIINTLSVDDPIAGGSVGKLLVGPNGRVYLARKSTSAVQAGVVVIDPTTGMNTELLLGLDVNSLALSADSSRLYALVIDTDEVWVFNTADLSVGGVLSAPGSARGHALAVSP